ncbi:MAG TPA: trypsin-like serine protease [Acidimicrobiales bacterium]|nr:trypsin-like serine protease [Acidimicrobiales bacterium]
MKRTNTLVVLLSAAVIAWGALPAAAIVDGTPATDGAWPAMVSVSAFGGHTCGGTLVASRWVLSAAHCYYDPNTPNSPPDPDPYGVFVGGGNLDSADYQPIEAIVIHPGYDPLRSVNDLALLRLADASAAPVQRLALRADEGLWDAGATATAVGYGLTSSAANEVSAQLLQVDVPVVGDADCDQDYGDIDDDRHLCAGERGSEDDPGAGVCQGDSGGPLFGRPTEDGSRLQLGVTSFGGPQCGVEVPGVWTEVAQYRGWIDDILGGAPTNTADPENPAPEHIGADAPIFRISDRTPDTEPVAQAAAVSLATFEDGVAQHAILTRADLFADGLGGSSLGFGLGPLLFSGASNQLPEETAVELQRAVVPGAPVYILGGPAAVPAGVDAQVRDLGFEPIRLAGTAREDTAALVAEEVVARYGDDFGESPVLDTMILSTSGNWPDAVTAGQIGSWWGIPIVLTPQSSLHPATKAILERFRPGRIFVMGGSAAISDQVAAQAAQAAGGSAVRLAGADRMGTAAEALRAHLTLFQEVGFQPSTAIAVNLHRPDAFAHVLSASAASGRFGGLFVPVDGLTGDSVAAALARAACGLDTPLAIAGSEDLVTDRGAEAVQAALLGEAC